MKKLVLGSLLLAALVSQTTGCIITSDDDSSDFATVDAEWSFRTVNPTGQLSPPNLCPSGVDTVSLHAQEVDSTGRLIGPEVIDAFNCVDMKNFSDPLPPGLYETWITVSGPTGLYATSISAFVDVTTSDKTFTAEIIDNGGYFKLGWDLKSQSTAAPLACRDLLAGKDRVGITATLVTNTSVFVADNFDCELGETFSTFSDAVAKGTYDVAIEPVDSNGGKIGDPVVLQDKVMGDRNSITDLGVVTLAFP
jgi:hypothetical protein